MFTYPLDPIYQMIYSFHEDFALWVLIFAVIFGFLLSFVVGANDSANSWGTPVGAGTVSFRVAVLLGFVAELLGAMFLSAGVVNGIAGSKSVVKVSEYRSSNETEWANFMNGTMFLEGERALMLGMLSSMLASQIWQLAATYLSWPVSGTHAIISSLVGFTLVEKSWDGINVGEANPFCASGIYKVLYGLFLSSFLALFIGLGMYYAIYSLAITSGRPKSLRNKLTYTFLVFFLFMVLGFNLSTAKSIEPPTLVTSETCLNPNKPLFGFLIGLATGLFAAVPFHFLLLDRLLNASKDFRLSLGKFEETIDEDGENQNVIMMHKMDSRNNVTEVQIDREETEFHEDQEIKNVFRPLQVIAAFFAALNHGGNDVGNCIGPLVTIYFIYKQPLTFDTSQDNLLLMAWGGLGIGVGLLMFGKRVIMTMGTKITPMTPSLGFIVVVSASLVVMGCTFLGIPTSTTHCQVMALVGAGIARGWIDTKSLKGGLGTVDMKVFRNIALSWICTIPGALAISAALYSALRVAIIGKF